MMRLRRLFKKEEISWAALVLEVFSVTLSVLVAMAIGDWHQERQKQKAVEQALRGIEAELAANQRDMESRLSYYQAAMKTLRERLATESPDAPALPLEGWIGLNPAQPTSAAYQAAIATQAFSNMDIETATSIAKIYSYQDLYGSLSSKFIDGNIAGRFKKSANLHDGIYEFSQFTQEMAKGYKAVRGSIWKKLGEPMPVPPSQVSAKP